MTKPILLKCSGVPKCGQLTCGHAKAHEAIWLHNRGVLKNYCAIPCQNEKANHLVCCEPINQKWDQ